MVFTQIDSDNFQRANENPLSDGGKWTPDASGTWGGGLQLVSDTAQPNGLAAEYASYFTDNLEAWPDDQYAEVTVGAIDDTTGSARIGPLVRMNPLTGLGYRAVVYTTHIWIEAVDSGSSFPLLAVYNGAVNPGDVVRLAVQGTTLTAYLNGTSVATATDTTYASGVPGLYLAAGESDNGTAAAEATLFAAGSISAGASGTSGPLSGIAVGTKLSNGQVEAIFPATVDLGHSADGVVYSGTLVSWNGLTGVIQAEILQGDAPFPKIAPGEGGNCRAYVADFTYTPSQGDRVAFIIVRTSAGDRNAKAITTAA